MRVIRACREVGIESVAVYSDVDANALHVALADRALRIGPAPAADSYLSISAIIAAARAARADAIHPGYGFLSENHLFVEACEQAGIVFIGPPSAVMARMGSKVTARQIAAGAGVPVVPGETPTGQTDEEVAMAARRIGFPVLIKPSEGGGGIGMKAVRDPGSLMNAIAQARREALTAFGDGTLYVERLIESPRHVEIQVLADHHGNVVHLFERECSLQRRHQKIIEETPSTALSPDLRTRMGDAAVALARAAGYRNAGTVEFLLDPRSERFYFLEMNTRLQVEHPVTEETTAIDLVHAQIAIAAGNRLPWSQDQLTRRGHAIEMRVYAEDPAQGHLPQAGPLLLYREPAMPGIRVDSGVEEGTEISVHYDPLIAKVIARGETREEARRRALTALRGFPILGIRTNVPFLIALLEHHRFVAGELDTRLVDTEHDALIAAIPSEPTDEARAVAAELRTPNPEPGSRIPDPGSRDLRDPWTSLRNWRV